MTYRYETHCHTNECSACSAISPAELVRFYSDYGYAGICVTDHFTGNSALPERTPWKKRVDYFRAVYEETRAIGQKHGLSVFFGIEYGITPDIERPASSTGNHFLIINPDAGWLRENKDVFTMRTPEIFKRVRAAGGFIIHAHPFNEKPSVECIRLLPYSVDAVEVMNGTHPDFVNDNAKRYAEAYGLLQTAGSDCHSENIKVFGGVETDFKCETVEDLVAAIREKKARPFKIVRGAR